MIRAKNYKTLEYICQSYAYNTVAFFFLDTVYIICIISYRNISIIS